MPVDYSCKRKCELKKVLPSELFVCEGQKVFLEVARGYIPPPCIQWQISPDGCCWRNLCGETCPILEFPAQLSQNGNFYRALIKTKCDCWITNKVKLTVISVQVQITNTPFCLGEDFELTALPSGGIPPYTFQWTGPNALVSNQQTITIIDAQESDSGLYEVTVTDSKGCSGSASLDVDVTEGPEVIAGSNSPICQGEDLMLTSLPSGGTPPYAFQWIGPNAFMSNAQNPTIPNAQPNASGPYTVTVTDANGCTAQNGTVVTVNANPTASPSSNSPICQGETLNLFANPAGGLAPYTFSWTGPNAFMSVLENPTIPNAQPNATGAYNLTITDANGCTGAGTTNVVVNPNPTVTPSSNSPICQGQTLTLFANPSGGLAPYTFSWTGPNAFVSAVENPIIPNAQVIASGAYNLTITDANGCTAMGVTAVTVNASPTVNPTSNSPITAGQTLNLIANPAGGLAPYTFIWTGPNAFSSMLENPSIPNAQVNATGTYNLTITDANGCTAMGSTNVIVNPVPPPP